MKICGYDYKMKVNQHYLKEGQIWSGSCEPSKFIIEVAENIPRQLAETTVIHEQLEALNHHLQLGLDHDTLSRVEPGMYQALVDNGVDLSSLLPELVVEFE